MFWKIAIQVLGWLVLFLVGLLDYKWFDKRTKNFQRTRRALFISLSLLLAFNTFWVYWEDRDKRQEIMSLSNQIGALNSQVKIAENSAADRDTARMRQIAKLQTMLEPILKMTRRQFPGARDEVAVQYLAQRIDSLEKHVADRTLSLTQKVQIVQALRVIQLGAIQVLALSPDHETIRFANTFRSLFLEAGWKANRVIVAMYDPPSSGLEIHVGSQTVDTGETLLQIFNDAGLVTKGMRNAQLEPNEIELRVGSK